MLNGNVNVTFFISAIPSGPFITPSPPVLVSAGDQLYLNCSSFGSLPRPNINWYINKTPVPLTARRVFNYQEDVASIMHINELKDGKLNCVLQLRLRIRESHFQVIVFKFRGKWNYETGAYNYFVQDQ